jgi:malonate decarboxylase alpha subunit
VVTEEGIAYLYKASSLEERRAALASIAGVSPIGLKSDPKRVQQLRRDGLVAFPEDLQVSRNEAKRSLLSARSMEDLVAWSGNLYHPPTQFRNW